VEKDRHQPDDVENEYRKPQWKKGAMGQQYLKETHGSQIDVEYDTLRQQDIAKDKDCHLLSKEGNIKLEQGDRISHLQGWQKLDYLKKTHILARM
jgi:hypothetical protein